MTDFTDVPAVNALYNERMLVDSAIAMIDAGGSLTQFTVDQPPPPAGSMPITTVPMVRITMPPPTPPDTLANVRAWLVQRQADIDAQLAALGVVNSPARRV